MGVCVTILKIWACKSPAVVFQMRSGGDARYMDIRASPNANIAAKGHGRGLCWIAG